MIKVKKILNRVFSLSFDIDKKFNSFIMYLVICLITITYISSSSEQNEKFIFVQAKQESESILQFLFKLYDGVGTKFEQKRKDVIIRKKTKKTEGEIDSTKKENRLEVRESENGDKYYIYLYVIEPEQKIKVTTYNMLGKKVLDVYNGTFKDFNNPYEIPSSVFPNGLYLCVVEGDKFRLAEKFIVSR